VTLALPRSKLSTPVFPYRSYVAGAHGKLPAARAWRVIARPAADFGALSQAVLDKLAPVAPAGALDGAYPVWVRLTDPGSRSLDGAPLLVDGDGWNLEPTGPDWRIEAIGSAGAVGDRFVYVVETVSTLEEAGQQNRPEESTDEVLAASWRAYGVSGLVDFGPGSIRLPKNTRALLWFSQMTAAASATTLLAVIEWTAATGITYRLVRQINSGGAAGKKCMGLWGAALAGANAPEAPVPAIGNLGPGDIYRLDLFPGTFPRNVRLGVYDSAINNRWDVDVYALR